MATFKVDKEQTKNSISILKTLLSSCEEAYNKEIPVSSFGKGDTHNELVDLCKNIKESCRCLGEVINNTILFLGGASDMFDTADKSSATNISVFGEGGGGSR